MTSLCARSQGYSVLGAEGPPVYGRPVPHALPAESSSDAAHLSQPHFSTDIELSAEADSEGERRHHDQGEQHDSSPPCPDSQSTPKSGRDGCRQQHIAWGELNAIS
jgi:hypothetical protein